MDERREQYLLKMLRKGDRDAFDEIYATLRPSLFSFLTRLSGSLDVAEDLSQETWFRLADAAPRLKEDTHLKAWLFTVARNLFVSRMRLRRYWMQGIDDLDEEMGLYGTESVSPFDSASASDTERSIEKALAALPVSQREVLLLVGVAQLAIGETAQAMGVSAEVVRQRLSRGRSRMAELMAAEKKKGGSES